MNMNKEALFIYEEDEFCELNYTYGDLCKLFVENNQLKEQKQELRIWLEEQYQEYKETSDERGIVLTSYVIDKLNELEGKNE